MRILVTGSRDWDNQHLIRAAMQYAVALTGATEPVLVHGGCPTGADALADAMARSWGWDIEEHHANWAKGKAAGPRRNQAMVDKGADVCLAFIKNNSRGATDCAQRAEAAGIPVMWHRERPPDDDGVG